MGAFHSVAPAPPIRVSPEHPSRTQAAIRQYDTATFTRRTSMTILHPLQLTAIALLTITALPHTPANAQSMPESEVARREYLQSHPYAPNYTPLPPPLPNRNESYPPNLVTQPIQNGHAADPTALGIARQLYAPSPSGFFFLAPRNAY